MKIVFMKYYLIIKQYYIYLNVLDRVELDLYFDIYLFGYFICKNYFYLLCVKF